MVERKRKSSLLNALSSTDLALDLLSSPACRIDGSCLEFTVLACVLDHLGKPLSAVICGEFSVGKCISKVTGIC
jgi:hypothetical protein